MTSSEILHSAPSERQLVDVTSPRPSFTVKKYVSGRSSGSAALTAFPDTAAGIARH